MHPDERAWFEQALRRRANRFAKLVSRPMSIDWIIANEFILLFKAALPLFGDSIRRCFFDWLGNAIRRDAGLCEYCGAKKPNADAAMCDACLDQAKKDDADALLEEAPETGRPS